MVAAIPLAATIPLPAALAVPASAADACDPAKLEGAYGFQLSGHTTISGDSKPVVSVGRLVFDGHGVLSGYASVNFAGYFLGNPVTGSYEAHDDCTISWSLQDDSGAFQHFTGKLTPDNSSAEFHQSDAGGAQDGILQKVAAKCSAAAFAQLYSFGIAGDTTPMNPGDVARQISAAGNHGTWTQPATSRSPSSAATANGWNHHRGIRIALLRSRWRYRRAMMINRQCGILVNGGKQILAMQTDGGSDSNSQVQRQICGRAHGLSDLICSDCSF